MIVYFHSMVYLLVLGLTILLLLTSISEFPLTIFQDASILLLHIRLSAALIKICTKIRKKNETYERLVVQTKISMIHLYSLPMK